MTLDEAIKQHEEVAEEHNKLAERIRSNMTSEVLLNHATKCENCASTYHQIAEWLKELKQLREQTSLKTDTTKSEDAISKASVFEIMGNLMSIPYDLDRPITEKDVSESMDEIRALTPVTPVQKTGKWIDFGLVDKDGTHEYKCSNCKNSVYDKERNIKYHKYCLHCSSRNGVEE